MVNGDAIPALPAAGWFGGIMVPVLVAARSVPAALVGHQGWSFENDQRCGHDGSHVEIIEQTDGKVDAFVCAVGTGGTLLGVSEALMEVNPEVKVYAVEPASSSLLKMAPQLRPYMEKYGIPGVAGWIITQIENRKLVAETYLVENQDAVDMAHSPYPGGRTVLWHVLGGKCIRCSSSGPENGKRAKRRGHFARSSGSIFSY